MDKLTNQEVWEISVHFIDELKENVEELKQAGKLSFSDIPLVYSIIVDTIVHIEEYAQTVKQISGAQKKEIAVIVLNRYINIPIIPEPVEAKLIAIVIDVVVAAINKAIGNKWNGKLFGG